MFDLEGSLETQLRKVMASRQTLIFPESEDPRVIGAAALLARSANIVLVGRQENVEKLIDSGAVTLTCPKKSFLARVRFADPHAEPIAETFAERLCEISEGKKWQMSIDEARKQVIDPVYFAIMAVRQGYADAVLGGITHSSRSFFMPCLRILEKERTVYEMALFALPDEHPGGIYRQNLVMFTDVALTVEPTSKALADIAVGACRTLRDMIPVDVLPEINGAVLSYSTRGSGQGPSVERVRGAEPLIQNQLKKLRKRLPLYESINIVTEMQISPAISVSAARTKLRKEYDHLRGVGRANVLIVPSLDVGNLLYHIYATRYPNAQSVLIIGGLRNQALDFSRSSTTEEIALGAKALMLRSYKSACYRLTPNDYFFPRYRILTVNPGSTSTKVALFAGKEAVARQVYRHSRAELDACKRIEDQLPLRKQAVERFMQEQETKLEALDAVVGRGGLVKPIESGTYLLCSRLLKDLANGVCGEHPSNLGGLIAHDIAEKVGIPAYTVDPPVVDELDAVSRITGDKDIEQEAAWHALSQKSAAKLFAEQYNHEYEELNLIVAHLGGGISVGSHIRGRCVKVRNALYDGPMSPNRAGSLPGSDLIDLCYSGISRKEVEKRLVKQGGLLSYLGSEDLQEVEHRIEAGDSRAELVFEAMTEQIAAEISSHVPKFKGKPIECIIITGGLCHSKRLKENLLRDLKSLNIPITVYPGEREMEALRDGALRVLRGVEQAREYHPLE